MPSCPINNKKRHFAVQRALKFNILFKGPYYDDIMYILDHLDTKGKTDFEGVFANYPVLTATFGQAEIDWLWNYLQHCFEKGTGGWDPVPDAATVGW